MKSILIATTNPGKLEEFFSLLKNLPAKLITPVELDLNLHVDEIGVSYADNAALKARAYCHASGLITLADDSGLEVAALGGAPGLFSARYCPEPGASDASRRAALLKNLRRLPRPWTAEFHAAVAIGVPPSNPNNALKVETIEGLCCGEIIQHEKGSNGFGYDPIFFFPEFNRTMAELTMEEKNQISHRARAINSAMPLLLSLL
ncbi:MAG: RdgB/HAM1 family non-canonical purine NTP pyrophosphatase [Anaerolineaceae bacterium]